MADFCWEESGEFVFDFGSVMHWPLCPAWVGIRAATICVVVESKCPVVTVPYDVERVEGVSE